MSNLLSYQEQIKYGQEASEYALKHGISLLDACAVMVDKYKLPVSAKTITNTFGAMKSYNRENGTELYDKDVIIRELENEIKEYQRKLSSISDKNEVVVYSVNRLTEKLNDIEIFKKRVSSNVVRGNRNEIAMLDLSDLHLGKKVDPRDVAGICHYDNDVFEEQCYLLVTAINEIIQIQRSGGINVKNLYINCLGDLVDGEMIYGGQQGELFRQTIDQIFVLGEYFIRNVFVPLAEVFDNIYIMAVDGNHGRVGKKKEGYDRKLNFDSILIRYWEQRLINHQNIFKFNISESPFMLYAVLGKYHLLSHSTNGGTSRWPMASMERFLNGINTLNRHIIDYVHLAHYHRDLKFNFNFSEIIVNGGWIGPDQFTVGKMTAGDYPFQRFYGLNRKHITWSYPIYLDKHVFVGENSCDVEYDVKVLTPTTKTIEPINIGHPAKKSPPTRLVKSFGSSIDEIVQHTAVGV